jgi:hypothetical protein
MVGGHHGRRPKFNGPEPPDRWTATIRAVTALISAAAQLLYALKACGLI